MRKLRKYNYIDDNEIKIKKSHLMLILNCVIFCTLILITIFTTFYHQFYPILEFLPFSLSIVGSLYYEHWVVSVSILSVCSNVAITLALIRIIDTLRQNLKVKFKVSNQLVMVFTGMSLLALNLFLVYQFSLGFSEQASLLLTRSIFAIIHTIIGLLIIIIIRRKKGKHSYRH